LFRKSLTMGAAAISIVMLGLFVPAYATVFTNESSFEAALGSLVTDHYSSSIYLYAPPGFIVLTDAAMNSKFNQTKYIAITHPNINIVGPQGDMSSALCWVQRQLFARLYINYDQR
jgi:hypothetical protein